MQRRQILYIIAVFAALLLIYEFVLVDSVLEAWNLFQDSRYSMNQQIMEKYRLNFLKILVGFIFRIGFYGTICIWSLHEAGIRVTVDKELVQSI